MQINDRCFILLYGGGYFYSKLTETMDNFNKILDQIFLVLPLTKCEFDELTMVGKVTVDDTTYNLSLSWENDNEKTIDLGTDFFDSWN